MKGKKKECRFRKDGDCGKCSNGTKGATINQWVGICLPYLGEDDCIAQ